MRKFCACLLGMDIVVKYAVSLNGCIAEPCNDIRRDKDQGAYRRSGDGDEQPVG